jgi:small conductance mechanosensitive channel
MEKLIELVDMQVLLTRLVEFVPRLMAGLLILFGFWLVFRLTEGPLKAILRRTRFHDTLIRLLVDSIYRFGLIIFGLVMAADQIGINVAAALAGIGVAGIAIGFAAQDSIANMISGFLIFFDKPFGVDDWVTVAEQYGRVQEITLRTTRIRTNNNTYVVIPNKRIIDEVLVNHSKHGATRIDVPIGIAYKESIPRAREVILEAVRGIEHVIENPAPDVVVVGLGASSVDLEARVWINEAAEEQPVSRRAVEVAKLALDKAGIEIPYPHLQLFVENVEDRVWQSASRLPALVARGGSATGE